MIIVGTMEKNYVIAIDGPAASGKSNTAKKLATALNYTYIDTGAMYRAAAYYVQQHKIDLEDFNKLEAALDTMNIKVKASPEGNRIFLNGEDISEAIREQQIGTLASKIGTYAQVRERLVELQREMGRQGRVVLDGRDIGTVVFPDADFKFYMTATLVTRAKRRWLELKERGVIMSEEEVQEELTWRDINDSTRAIAPLCKAEDAVEIDTTDLTIEGQVKKLMEIIKEGCEEDV